MPTTGTIYDETIKYGVARVITRQNASNSANITFISGLEDTQYDGYCFDFNNLIPSVEGALLAYISFNGGSTWVTDWWYGMWSTFTNYAPVVAFYGNQDVGWATSCFLSHGYAAGSPLSGYLRLWQGPQSASSLKYLTWRTSYNMSASNYGTTNSVGGGYNQSAITRVTAVMFALSVGVFTTGSITMSGMKTV